MQFTSKMRIFLRKNLVLFVLLLSCSAGAKSEVIDSQWLTELQKDITLIQSKKPNCQDLNSVSCVQQKINFMYELDQHVRIKTEKYLSDEKNFLAISKVLEQIDSPNTNEMKKILKLHGWVTISKFGKETDKKAWYLIQHADHDLEFQASVAFLLEQLAEIGETDQRNFAYLYDRVIVNFQNLGLKQKYGTQSILEGKHIKIEPFIGTYDELNQRRKKIGLNSIEENQKQLADNYLSNSKK